MAGGWGERKSACITKNLIKEINGNTIMLDPTAELAPAERQTRQVGYTKRCNNRVG